MATGLFEFEALASGKRRRHRAGRAEDMASPVDGVVLPAEIMGDGAKAMVLESDSTVASTEEDSFS
jgi:hypothetical protein